MKIFILSTFLFFAIVCTSTSQEPASPSVVVSIGPIHSLAAGIMEGVAKPKLLLRSGGSPHSSALRPSDLEAIQQADLIIWVGPSMEQFLTKALHAAKQEDVILTLLDIPGLTLHPVREGGIWNDDHHADHAEDHHDNTTDPHIWLNPDNAVQMTKAIRDRLIKIDSTHSGQYTRNSDRLIKNILALDRQLQRQTEPIRTTPYIVFHDAYQTFETRYNLSPAGAVTIDPERRPGARRLGQIRRYILESQAVCLFSEPQFEPRYIMPLTEGTDIRLGVLDPLGSRLTPGPELYFQLMTGLGDALVSCLAPEKTP